MSTNRFSSLASTSNPTGTTNLVSSGQGAGADTLTTLAQIATYVGNNLPQPLATLFNFTAPINSNYSWLNQGSATVDATYAANSGIFLSAPAQAGSSLRGRQIAAPATPYKIDLGFIPLVAANTSSENPGFGLYFYESSSGKAITWAILSEGGATQLGNVYLVETPWTDVSTPGANYYNAASTWLLGAIMRLRVQDDGANLKFSFTNDGKNYLQLDSRARNGFFTTGPSHVGFCALAWSATNAASGTVVHWAQS